MSLPVVSDNPERDAIFDKWGIPPENYRPAPPPEKPADPTPASADDGSAEIAPVVQAALAESNRQHQEFLASMTRIATPPPAPPAAPEFQVDDIVPPPEIAEAGATAVAQYVAHETAKRLMSYADQRAMQAQQLGAAQAVQAIEGARIAAATAPTWASLPDAIKAGVHNQLMATNQAYQQADFAGKLTIAEAATKQFVAQLSPKADAGASTVQSNIGGGGGARPSGVDGAVKANTQEAMARQLVQQFGLKR